MSAVEALLVLLELARARAREAGERDDVQDKLRWMAIRALAQIALDEWPKETGAALRACVDAMRLVPFGLTVDGEWGAQFTAAMQEGGRTLGDF